MRSNIPRTCVTPSGEFSYGIHKPRYTALNLRENDYITTLGHSSDQKVVDNTDNFPPNQVEVAASGWVFEIPNAFPFMGATFILKSYADGMIGKANPFQGQKRSSSDHDRLKKYLSRQKIKDLPRAMLLTLAKVSTDPGVLTQLAELSCQFELDAKAENPLGISYEKTEKDSLRPLILDKQLFDIVSNNLFLPDSYKQQMVLIPGAQGKSPVVGEYLQGGTHIWEYLRENSYIPWGHYAANMAQDAIRYKVEFLTEEDIIGLRHLYYQRIYVQLATEMDMVVPAKRRSLSTHELEDLRLRLLEEIKGTGKPDGSLRFNATVWGQNFGFGLCPSGYRLNASHQQVHQQFALVPSHVPGFIGGKNDTSQSTINTYIQGDLVDQFCREYKLKTGQDFFETYLNAIQNNKRMDGRADKASDLIFYQDENVMAFVPKAQRSQGEIQVISKKKCGNILETDTEVRHSLDRAILVTLKVLESLGAEMITIYEISKRFDRKDCDQRLIYSFLPKHAQSPGGFSEGQQRWIIGHYPEDFAQACRDEVQKLQK